MNKCIFLDRDGVLNRDKVDYVYQAEDHVILEGVVEALSTLKRAGYLLVIITNQSGIAKGLYSAKHVKEMYLILQQACGNLIDGIYFSPYHPKYDSECLSRKPYTLLFEKAIAKFKIDTSISWMVGDRARDLVPAKKLGMKTALILSDELQNIDSEIKTGSLLQVSHLILSGFPF